MRLSFFSMRAAHEAQVMPLMVSSTSEAGAGVAPLSVFSGAVLVMRISWARPGRTASVSAERYGPARGVNACPCRVEARKGELSGRADELVAGLVDGGADGLLVERGGGGDGDLPGFGDRRDRGDA